MARKDESSRHAPRLYIGVVWAFLISSMTNPSLSQPVMEVRPVPDSDRVDVFVDGALFTSYVHAETLAVLKKPVLHPIFSAEGVEITRSYPLGTRAWERVDHPHQIGLWFNYGDVNGLDFWNNSNAVEADRQSRMGTIRHREVLRTEGGAGRSELEVAAVWQAPDGTALLQEHTRFVFHADDGYRAIDRTTTLTAGDTAVEMPDNKEGVLGLRVRRELEMPAGRPLRLTDAEGRELPEPIEHDEGVGGRYRNSDGVVGYPEVWGKRARWTALSGEVDAMPVTIAILDHPDNPGFPTYWHARDYGLFAANPLGPREFSEGEETFDFRLERGESATFRYRVVVFSRIAADEEIEGQYTDFAEGAR